LMIWANCIFSFNMSFMLRKVEDVPTIIKLHSLTVIRLINCTLRVILLHYFFTSNNKRNLYSFSIILMGPECRCASSIRGVCLCVCVSVVSLCTCALVCLIMPLCVLCFISLCSLLMMTLLVLLHKNLAPLMEGLCAKLKTI